MIDVPEPLSRLRRPEYTGSNRCAPCTVVNVGIAFGLAAGVGAVVGTAPGLLALVAFLGIIGLRGYLVPGTPTLTRRYLPARLRSLFGKETDPRPAVTSDFDANAVLESLSAADVLTVAESADGPQLSPSFRSRWNERISQAISGPAPGTNDTAATGAIGATGAADADIVVEPAAIAALFDAETAARRGDASVELDGQKLVRWPSEAALAADVAADRELAGRLTDWESLDVEARRDVRTGLRLLRERCPVCDGTLSRRASRLEHCCRRPRIGIESVCLECDRSLVSVAVPEDDGGEGKSGTENESKGGTLLEWLPEDASTDATGR